MLLGVLSVLASAAGCEHSSRAELATLEQITPADIEVGEQLTLLGSGFIVGQAVLELEGTLSAPGQDHSDQATKMELAVLATSPTSATARLGRRHLDRTSSGHMTFSGRALLRFESAAGPNAPHVVASLDSVRLELFSGPTAHQSAARRNHLRGQAFLDELGVTGATLPEGRGVLIERLRSAATGARAGLAPGEIIVTAGNVTVASVADLAPPPRTDSLSLGIRDINGQIRRVTCMLEQPGHSVDADRIAAFSISVCALLIIIVVAGPLRGLFSWLGSLLVDGSNGPRDILSQFTNTGRERPLLSLVSMLLFASAPFVVMATAHFGVVPVAGLVVMASFIAGITATSGWRRLVVSAMAVIRTVPLIMATAICALRAASMNLNDVVSAQGAEPWHWHALSDPACLLLVFILFATVCSGSLGRIGPSIALLRGLTGAFIAALLLGGWSLSAEHALWGQILFAVKAWALGLCMLHGGRGQVIAVLLITSPLAAASLAINLVPLPQWAPAALTWSTASTMAFVVIPLVISSIVAPRARLQKSNTNRDGARKTHGSTSTHRRVPSFESLPGHS